MNLSLILLGLLLVVAMLQVILLLKSRSAAPDTTPRLDTIDRALERLERTIRDEAVTGRDEQGKAARQTREELTVAQQATSDALLRRMSDIAALQKDQLDTFAKQLATLTQLNETKLTSLRETVEVQLKSLQEDNSTKLEQMRATVDEKLHATLEQRLGESFKQVSERLEQVHKGLGEMQSLATGVGDLKKVLTNVKTRGTFGEIQLGSLLEQILTVEQYATNIATRPGSSERVEFAIKLPGRDPVEGGEVWLPLDAKFPQEDYLRLVEAQEQGNPEAVVEAGKQLERQVKLMAAAIRDKYLDPPHTTDFGLMFLPTEGLYAEVLRRPGLCELLQREFRVVLTGPTTLAALLNSLQLGFRTLAIEKRSSEVWKLLGAVKTEFSKFGDILEKTKKKLDEASNSIDTATVRTRAIERKLRGVQDLPSGESRTLLGEAAEQPEEEAE